ncbi:hypothetical protein [Nonlabens sp.]|uniref:hypothetical protein n=1 Tax=Nonlabens sp. TaxID=1888209 RepID=UPI003F6A0C4D
MSFLDTKEKKKSFIITTVLMSVFLLLFVFVSVLEPLPEEEETGIAINFGNTAVGSGPVEPAKPTQLTPESNPTPVETTPQVDNIATQDIKDAPVINSDPNVTKPVTTPVKKPVDTKPQPKPDPKPDQSVLDALNNVTGATPTDGENNTGEGPGDGPGNKGDINGNPYANTYYGAPGSGQSGRGAGLGGRKALSGKGAEPDCFETGTVIVEIHVNRSGKVVQAIPGKKGTTNRASCLLIAAKKSAETYRFSPANKAKDIQIGFVEVIFKVGE